MMTLIILYDFLNCVFDFDKNKIKNYIVFQNKNAIIYDFERCFRGLNSNFYQLPEQHCSQL